MSSISSLEGVSQLWIEPQQIESVPERPVSQVSERQVSQVSLKVEQLDQIIKAAKEVNLKSNKSFLDPIISQIVQESEQSEKSKIKGVDGGSGSGFGGGSGSSFDKRIGLFMLPDQSQKHSQRVGGSFNLMVAGSVGTGKTSFINTLFNCDLLPVGNGFSKDYLDIHRFELIDDNYPLKLTVIETTGLGQNINNEGSWLPISDFVDEQFQLFLFQDQQPNRHGKRIDTRVHCCLYFLPPNLSGITPLDLETMKALSDKVNLIPIVGKCDSMESVELQVYKNECHTLFRDHGIRFCDFLEDEGVYSLIANNIPLSVISANGVETLEDGTKIRGRKYPWGFVELENSNNCDFNLIRKILMTDHMLDFIVSTEGHYEQFRSVFLQSVLDKTRETEREEREKKEREKKEKEKEKEDGKGEVDSKAEVEISSEAASSPESTNGLDQFKIYNKTSFNQYKQSMRDQDKVLKYKEQILKTQFNQKISVQEKRFKGWKRALVAKQKELNDDMELTHERLVDLKQMVDEHEDLSPVSDSKVVPVSSSPEFSFK